MNFTTFLVNELYTDKPSYFAGEKVKIYSSTNSFFSTQLTLKITNLSRTFFDEIDASISHQEPNSDNVLKEGLNYSDFFEYHIPENCKSGIYLINETYPFIVKSKLKSEITVVFPFLNNVLYSPVDNNYAFDQPVTTASFYRTSVIDKFTEGLTDFFKYMEGTYAVNYITDIELGEINNITSKLVVIYGKSTFWTPKMKESFFVYQKSGGNLLNITSYLANNICWYNHQNEIRLLDTSTSIEGWIKYDSMMPLNISGVSYLYSGYSEEKSYNVIDEKHPILKGILEEKIKIKGGLFSAPPVKWMNDSPKIDLNFLDFYDGEIVAYSDAAYKKSNKGGVKGIFVLQPDSESGKIVSLGSEDWCLKENIGEKEQLEMITKNAVAYLLD